MSVLVERLSRKAFLIKNNNKTSKNVMLKIALKAKTISAEKSITFDNGGEFTQFGLTSARRKRIRIIHNRSLINRGFAWF